MKNIQIAAMATVSVFGLLFAPQATFSQTKNASPAAATKPVKDMEYVREKLRTDKKILIAGGMQFTETESKGFWPVYDQYEAESAKLNDRMIKLIGEYANQFNAKTMTNESSRKMLDDYLLMKADRQKLLQTYLPKFRMVLSDLKVSRFYQIENKIQAAVDYEMADVIPLVK